jgi:hypothetical protein
MTLPKTLLALVLALAPLALTTPALADKAPIWSSFGSSVAISGYDPVAYFTLGRPTQGSASFKATFQGAEFRFASAANRDALPAMPPNMAAIVHGRSAKAIPLALIQTRGQLSMASFI